MGSTLPYAALAVAAVGAWSACLVTLGILTPPEVRAWRRIASLRGLAMPRRLERWAVRVTIIRRLQEELDLHRLLSIAHREESPLAFLAGTAFAACGITGVVAAVLFTYRAVEGEWPLGAGPWAALLALVAVPVLRMSGLRAAARRRQDRAGRALGDMMMMVAVMTDGRGLQLEDAVRILSRCLRNDSLATLVEPGGWGRLVTRRHRSTIELYRMIGEAYSIPMFGTVADAAANTNLGFPERDTYTAVATAVYAQRLAEARMHGARAKTLVTLPIAAMLLPLLLLLGAPALSTITSGLG